MKLYFAVNGAVHDAAVAAWGLKRKYDSVRPISAIRYLGGHGQSSDPEGLPLVHGLVEPITAETTLPGQRGVSRMWSMRRALWLGLVVGLLAGPRMAGAQVDVADPKYHGTLSIRRAAGTIDRDTGSGMVRTQSWKVEVTGDTNGIFPDQEPIVLAVGEESFTLPAGMLKVSRNGRAFSYRAAGSEAPHDVCTFRFWGREFPCGGTGGGSDTSRGVHAFRLWLRRDGSYGVRFTLGGVDVSRLQIEDPICLPLAVIVGDDDFFDGVRFTSPSFASPRLTVPGRCPLDDGDWPWIRG